MTGFSMKHKTALKWANWTLLVDFRIFFQKFFLLKCLSSGMFSLKASSISIQSLKGRVNSRKQPHNLNDNILQRGNRYLTISIFQELETY